MAYVKQIQLFLNSVHELNSILANFVIAWVQNLNAKPAIKNVKHIDVLVILRALDATRALIAI
jgi:hypothetical protein